MNITNWILDNADTVANIVTATAGIAAIIVAIVFSRLQQTHNINSVRPICEIDCSDYENLIAVKILNVGTGPMTISSLQCVQGDKKSSVLLDLMPDKNIVWDDYMENVDGRTIPVNGEITLIEKSFDDDSFNNENIKNDLRTILMNITIHVEYKDIYKKTFTKTRKLDFFGRHYEIHEMGFDLKPLYLPKFQSKTTVKSKK